MKESRPAIDRTEKESLHSNPYAITSQHAHPYSSDVELIRHNHLKLEMAIQWIGAIYLLIGCFGILLAVLAAANVILQFSYGSRRGSVEAEMVAVVSFLAAAFSCIFIATTLGLRKFKNWARGASIMLAVVIGLFLFPIGTLVCAFFLYVLLHAKTTFIFSDEYQAVIEQTPHMICRSYVLLWLLLGIVLIAVILVSFYFNLGVG